MCLENSPGPPAAAARACLTDGVSCLCGRTGRMNAVMSMTLSQPKSTLLPKPHSHLCISYTVSLLCFSLDLECSPLAYSRLCFQPLVLLANGRNKVESTKKIESLGVCPWEGTLVCLFLSFPLVFHSLSFYFSVSVSLSVK